MKKDNDALESAREIINQVDKEMASLFEKRMQAVKEIAEYKKQRGLKILDSSREQEIVEKNSKLISDQNIRSYYVNFLKDNMQVSRSYQEQLIEGLKVGYCGTIGAFAYIATSKLFPNSNKIAFGDFESAYKSVENGECDIAVLPIENSSNGEVGQVTDLLFNGSLYVNDVTELEVTHNLLGTKDANIDDVKQVVSHSQALGQCYGYIKERGFRAVEYANTALAAKFVAEQNDKSIAAIASIEAGEIFGLKVLEKNVNASRTNTTKFAIVSRVQNQNSLTEKDVQTMLMFTVRHQAGALAKAIEIIGKYGFNMQAIRSRPMKQLLWQYYFYVEAEGNINTEQGQLMIKELSKYCDKLKVLGTYKK